MSKLNVDFCCTCLKVCSKKEKLINLSLKGSQEITYRNKLKSCVPEMILQNTEDCYLCGPCAKVLENAYKFRCMCLLTNNKLKEYRASKQRNFKDICSLREDLLQVLSQELRDIEQENCLVIESKDLGSLLTETLIKQESNTALQSIKTEIDEFILSSEPQFSDEDLIQKACKSIPELRNIPASSLNCWVTLEKTVIGQLPVIIPSDNDRKKSSLYCGICDKVIKKKDIFYSHMLRHSNVKGYKCDNCPAAYFSLGSLRYHERHAHSDHQLPNKVNLNVSHKKVVSPKLVEKKKSEIKKKKPGMEKCIFKIKLPSKSANEKTASIQSYDRHITKPRNGGSYVCTICSKSYSAQWVLTRHMHVAHKGIENKKTKSSMPPPIQVKEEVIDGDDIEVCTICNDQFSSKDEYKNHLKIHTQKYSIEPPRIDSLKNKKKRYYCSICRADFSSKDHANTHTGARPYTCHMCSKSFSAYDSLRKHRYTKNHKERANAKNPTKYVCEICQKEFQESAELFAHNCQTSSGESVYRCQICKNAYLGRTALIDHMRIHVGQN